MEPDYAEAYNNRGNAKVALKYFPEAMTDLNKAISLTKKFAEAYYNRGNLFTLLKKLKKV